MIVSPKSGPEQGRKLQIPGGSPASSAILKTYQLERTAVLEGFQRQTFPMRVGVRLRLPPMAVKLNGVTAAMKPSIPLSSARFHTLGEWCSGCTWWRESGGKSVGKVGGERDKGVNFFFSGFKKIIKRKKNKQPTTKEKITQHAAKIQKNPPHKHVT